MYNYSGIIDNIISKETKKNIIASSIGAIIAELVTIPVCTLRTQYQTMVKHNYVAYDYIKDIYKCNVIKGFYNASWASSCSQVLSFTIKYTAYENIKKIKNKNNPNAPTFFIDNLLISITSSWCASVFHHPFDVTRVHIQRNDNIKQLIKQKGIFRFFSAGYKVTLLNNTSKAIIFPLHDHYKQLLNQNQIQYTTQIAPVLTSTTSILILYPLDYIRNRIISNLDWRHGLSLQYYRGFTFGLTRNVIHFSILINIADLITKKIS